ncbi:MAG: hypothetical protein C0601_08005 [Candidatus Muiribacterium halophilum]|uniref:HTH cro/C1-type domain-containing protein n=1 Tax=Muiribacterium halophilum TaxID=2053465 RepID=A0A2N5ZF66_MUIH1|nr:MAG: hypothetical protein C0601_08005 [Candidatus Muirbacterium halophilum]
MVEEFKKRLGKRIKIYRIQKEISQEALARKSEIHTTHLSKIENGKANITIEILYKISLSLGVKVQDLFYEPRKSQEIESYFDKFFKKDSPHSLDDKKDYCDKFFDLK